MTELPIACTLDAAAQRERGTQARALVADALLDSAVTERGASLRFSQDAEAELRALIAAESECCAFLDFDLRPDGSDALRLTVEGPAEARPIILGLFGLESAAP